MRYKKMQAIQWFRLQIFRLNCVFCVVFYLFGFFSVSVSFFVVFFLFNKCIYKMLQHTTQRRLSVTRNESTRSKEKKNNK